MADKPRTEIELNVGAPPQGKPKKERPKQTDEELLRTLLEDPSALHDEENYDEEEVLRIQRLLNPLSRVLQGEATGQLVASVINMRAGWCTKFEMTKLVSFIFQMLEEHTVPDTARRWEPRSKKKKAAEAAAPPRPAELRRELEAAAELAKLAEANQKTAEELVNRAASADLDVKAAEIDKPGSVTAKRKAEAKALGASAHDARRAAAAALFAAVEGAAKVGIRAEKSLDAAAQACAEFPDVADYLRRAGRLRPDAGVKIEMPADVAKDIIRQFLMQYLEYDPSVHVRSSHDEKAVAAALDASGLDKHDPERPTLESLRRQAAPPAALEDQKLFERLTRDPRTLRAALTALDDADVGAALAKLHERRDSMRESLRAFAIGEKKDPALLHIPPQDTFHRLNYYAEVNYERLRIITAALFHEKPELDWLLGAWDYLQDDEKIEPQKKNPKPRDEWKTASEKFKEFCQKNEDHFPAKIHSIGFGGWTVLGDWSSNRFDEHGNSKINYFNRHTEVLERIMNRHAEDVKLGAELMKNRVRKEKAKNIREAGPDPAGLKEYQRANNQLGALRTEKPISPEEMRRLESARGDLKLAAELKARDELADGLARLAETEKERPLKGEEVQQRAQLQIQFERARGKCLELRRELAKDDPVMLQELKNYDEFEAKVAHFADIAKARELTSEEKRDELDAKKAFAQAIEMLEVPRDGIQIDVLAVNARTGDAKKTKMYTKAHAPDKSAEAKRGGELKAQFGDSMHPMSMASRAKQPKEEKGLAPYALALLQKEQEHQSDAQNHRAALADAKPAPGLGLLPAETKKS